MMPQGLPPVGIHWGLGVCCCHLLISGSDSFHIWSHFILTMQWNKFKYKSPFTEKLAKFNTMLKIAHFVSYQVKLWIQIWVTLNPTLSNMALPRGGFCPSPLRPLCAGWNRVGEGGVRSRIANWKCMGPDSADIHFDWQAEWFWLPIFNNWRSSHKNLIPYLSFKNWKVAILAPIPLAPMSKDCFFQTWSPHSQWPTFSPFLILLFPSLAFLAQPPGGYQRAVPSQNIPSEWMTKS